MPNKSIIKEITQVESALTNLSTAVLGGVKTPELREDYYSLIQQACLAINKMRSLAETDDFFKPDRLREFLDKNI